MQNLLDMIEAMNRGDIPYHVGNQTTNFIISPEVPESDFKILEFCYYKYPSNTIRHCCSSQSEDNGRIQILKLTHDGYELKIKSIRGIKKADFQGQSLLLNDQPLVDFLSPFADKNSTISDFLDELSQQRKSPSP